MNPELEADGTNCRGNAEVSRRLAADRFRGLRGRAAIRVSLKYVCRGSLRDSLNAASHRGPQWIKDRQVPDIERRYPLEPICPPGKVIALHRLNPSFNGPKLRAPKNQFH